MASMATLTFGRILGAGAALSLLAAPVMASAQDTSPDARLRKIEAEVRALQRKVFPGGDGRFFEPQITAPQSEPTATSTIAAQTGKASCREKVWQSCKTRWSPAPSKKKKT